MNLIIGLSGKRGVGKTTAANFLVKDLKFIKLSLADKLRSISCEVFPFRSNELSGMDKENKYNNYDWTPREFMIRMGEFIRYWDKDYFINNVVSNISGFINSRVVIDDVRFLNEADKIKKLGGNIIRIERYKDHNPYKGMLDHPSETELDNYNFDNIINEFQNISLDDLHKSIISIIKILL